MNTLSAAITAIHHNEKIKDASLTKRIIGLGRHLKVTDHKLRKRELRDIDGTADLFGNLFLRF